MLEYVGNDVDVESRPSQRSDTITLGPDRTGLRHLCHWAAHQLVEAMEYSGAETDKGRAGMLVASVHAQERGL